MPAGRPSDYTYDVAFEICERLSVGQTLTKIAARPEFPHLSTIFRWLEKHEEFRELYARARSIQADVFTDEIIDIADESEYDLIEEDGKPKVNWEHVNRSRLRIDARKWKASKTAPKKYGDRIHQEHTGSDGGPILTGMVNSPPAMTRDEWMKAYGNASNGT